MNQTIILLLSTLIFYLVGGVIDYWQSARQHNKHLPLFLKNYFALFWLILYSGLLPLFMVYAASGFNNTLVTKYIGAALIGMSLWDMTYALFEKGKLVVGIKEYWFWGNKNYGLTKNQLISWHLVRITIGLVLIFNSFNSW